MMQGPRHATIVTLQHGTHPHEKRVTLAKSNGTTLLLLKWLVASPPAGPPSSAAGRSAADQEELPNVPLSWAAAARKWRAERASVAGSGVALQAPIPSAAPAACTSTADYQQAARLPWAVPAGFTAPLKKASTKRAAPPSSASAPSAKRAFTSPYNEFCKEQRPLLPAKTNNKDREKLLGELAS